MFEALDPSFPLEVAQCVCLGSGRFLRAVLVPSLETCGVLSIVAQPRGTSFVEHMAGRGGLYEVDTVLRSGQTRTRSHRIVACGSLADDDGKSRFLALPARCPGLRYIGVGVTEAGIADPSSKAMRDLYALLRAMQEARRAEGRGCRVSVICTDNMPDNGSAIRARVTALHAEDPSAAASFLPWLADCVEFHNSMVDCITSHRAGDPLVPRAEPLPAKALVVEDLRDFLPPSLLAAPGLILRTAPGRIELDHALKLRVANGLHTASVYALALSRLEDTRAFRERCPTGPLLRRYIDALFVDDILPGLRAIGAPEGDAWVVYEDWRARLRHPHFGLATLFITQNSSLKLRVRLMPSFRHALLAPDAAPSALMQFAVACMLRFLWPAARGEGAAAFAGAMAAAREEEASAAAGAYPGGRYSYAEGRYDFVDGGGAVSSALLGGAGPAEAVALALRGCLDADAPPAASAKLRGFQKGVEALLLRLGAPGGAAGEAPLALLAELLEARLRAPLGGGELAEAVREEVRRCQVVDLHTHLLPPSHGGLFLSGIDELLTYHYLVAEFFQTADGVRPAAFYARPKAEQAQLVWDALFVERAPLSEACRGVCTTLSRLGLGALLRARDLAGIRAWFAERDPEAHCERVFELAGVRYCVMTNIPFSSAEAACWRPARRDYSERFRSALRVDPVLAGDWAAVSAELAAGGYEESAEGARRYLVDWAGTMRPEYLMASTAEGFRYPGAARGGGVDMVADVLVEVARELKLPIALKIGAVRGLSPEYGMAGDGVEVADLKALRNLCSAYPDVKFLATVLSRDNQHELAVLANKFRNLHVYGCWWYCNNPSVIDEIVRLRLEILGTAHTAQHSDCRVLEQLIYKWDHSRRIIAEALGTQVRRSHAAGWAFTRGDIRREVHFLLGGCYEQFVRKAL